MEITELEKRVVKSEQAIRMIWTIVYALFKGAITVFVPDKNTADKLLNEIEEANIKITTNK